jgi:hypothetical protein
MGVNEDLSDFGLVDEETYRFLDQLFEGDIAVVVMVLHFYKCSHKQRPLRHNLHPHPSKDLRELQKKISKIYKIVDNQVNKKKH